MAKKKEAIAIKFAGASTSVPAATVPTGKGPLSPEEKAALAKAKAEQARAAIAEAKAKVAARTVMAKGSSSSGTSGTSPATTPVGPKVKKASRVVSLIKLRKMAQGEDKIPASSRLHVYIRSPTFPVLDDKAVFVDKVMNPVPFGGGGIIKGTFGIVFKADRCAFILLSCETKTVDLDCGSCHGQDY